MIVGDIGSILVALTGLATALGGVAALIAARVNGRVRAQGKSIKFLREVIESYAENVFRLRTALRSNGGAIPELVPIPDYGGDDDSGIAEGEKGTPTSRHRQR